MLRIHQIINPLQPTIIHSVLSSSSPAFTSFNHSLSSSKFLPLQFICFWVFVTKSAPFMAAKVPKFGAWEGGENFTVCFDNARKVKNNGPTINPNDPQENPAMFPQKGTRAKAPSAHNRAQSQGQAKVPQFGAWDSGDNVGYTMYFENARKTKNNGGPTVAEKEPEVKRDAPAQAKAQAQAPGRPAKIKPEPQEPRSKVPQFGGWENGGDAAYTMCFDNVRKNKNGQTNVEEPSNEPQMNRDVAPQQKVAPTSQEARAKVPQFGAWNGGETAAYTACFDNARINKSGGTGPVSVEPQLNRDVGSGSKPRPDQRGAREDVHVRNASRGSIGSMAGSERPGGQSPLHPKGGKPQQSKSGNRGGQNAEKAATIPPFGVWNQDPSQAEGFTGTFERAWVEKRTPLNKNVPPSYQQQTQYEQEPKKGCCCFPW